MASLLLLGPTAAAPAGPSTLAKARAEIAALGGAMPSSFDFYPADACSGVWDARYDAGDVAMKLTVFRYHGVPLVHITGTRFGNANYPVTRLDPRAIKVSLDSVASLVLRCASNRAVVTMINAGTREPFTLNATPGVPDVAPAPPPVVAPQSAAPPLAGGSVRVEGGDIFYAAPDKGARRLTRGGGYSDPVLSPDGRTVAFVHLDSDPDDDNLAGRTSLWTIDVTSGAARQLLDSRPDEDNERNLASFSNPRFSLNGGFLYIDADAWATSTAIHQVNVRTGTERFIVAGWTTGVIRNGPYAGHLIVGQHRYWQTPKQGSYNPLSIMRPDGTMVLMIPGTNRDDITDDGQALQAAWLKAHGWRAD